MDKQKKETAYLILSWYDRHRRVLPWRAPPGQRPDPYHVLLSEIMLQQTGVTTVGPYFIKFIKDFPDISSLAAAKLDSILRLWAGLGYYRRARNLHACAKILAKRGAFPREEKELLALPGIGPYTAAAIRAIAFDQKANVVDGNVERVVSRLFAVRTPLPKAKKELREKAETLLPKARYGDYAQALMDLGATICVPKSPKCAFCPLASLCAAKEANPDTFPRREKKKAKPVRRGVAFVAFARNGMIFLQKRPDRVLLGGMTEVPSTEWLEGPGIDWEKARKKAPFAARWRLLPGVVHHTFTHFDLELAVAVAETSRRQRGLWVAPEDLKAQALPSVMRKILQSALAHRGRKDRQ